MFRHFKVFTWRSNSLIFIFSLIKIDAPANFHLEFIIFNKKWEVRNKELLYFSGGWNNKQVAEWLLEIWPNILKIWHKLPNSKRPNSKSFLDLQSAINDLFTPPKLSFFSFVAEILQPFFVKYQTDDPMVLYLSMIYSMSLKKSWILQSNLK